MTHTRLPLLVASVLVAIGSGTTPRTYAEDQRALVELPAPMQAHMLANMRDHLTTLDEILRRLGQNDLEAAGELAEQRLGMSALDDHGAAHIGRFMPSDMRELGTAMHRAASRFALRAEEGEPLAAYRSLGEITAACVACHNRYRIR